MPGPAIVVPYDVAADCALAVRSWYCVIAALLARGGPDRGLVADPPHARTVSRGMHAVATVPTRMSTLVSWSEARRSCNTCAAPKCSADRGHESLAPVRSHATRAGS